jgi:hypothetical protein
MSIRTAYFNIKGTTTSFLGFTIEDGISNEPFLEFQFPDDFEYEEGADGLVVICATNATLVTCTMNLVQSSRENDKLSLARSAGLKAGGGAAVGTFLYKDNNGTSLIASPRAWIHKPPNWAVARKVGVAAWDLRLQVAPGDMLLGGHSVE